MVDKHAISPLNQQDKTPGQYTEDRAGQSAISRFTRRAFLGRVSMAGIATSAVPFLQSARAEEVQTPAATATVEISGAVPMVVAGLLPKPATCCLSWAPSYCVTAF